ncbi:ABC transporter permease [Pseudoclavibacter sp. VKM Ac-2867]|uniref:ABC transporter permease n=1 Tax=Pseudoclavibacter sp. VKM Ac-2867 TaxID=2783829 RepID=UPI00188C0C77|nr:FtsX-like permease family protein [Pseudoclavibacter sp. VKM Ac-2867]MBF4457717.1 FtsX-like permease family protein [Pseudoclavibacter sp. VKM Ac-2867]
MIRLALHDVVHYRREAAGVVSQVAIGIALFVIALSFVGSIGQNADRLVFGSVGATWLVEPSADAALSFDAATAQRFSSASGAESVRPRLQLTANISNPNGTSARPESASVSLIGADLSAEPQLADNLGLPAERIGTQHIELHEKTASRLGVTAGDEVSVSVAGVEISYTVDDVVTPDIQSFLMESWAIVDRVSLAERVHGDPGSVNTILVDADDDESARAGITAAAAELGTPSTVSSWSETSWSALMLGPKIWGILLVSIFTFTYVVICIGLTSLIYSAMLSRVGDLAVLKAVGMRGGTLRRMYLAEVVAQFIVGYAVGALLAVATVAVVNFLEVSSTDSAFAFAVGSTKLHLDPSWWAFAAPFAIGITLTGAVLWFPVHGVSKQPALTLLELR